MTKKSLFIRLKALLLVGSTFCGSSISLDCRSGSRAGRRYRHDQLISGKVRNSRGGCTPTVPTGGWRRGAHCPRRRGARVRIVAAATPRGLVWTLEANAGAVRRGRGRAAAPGASRTARGILNCPKRSGLRAPISDLSCPAGDGGARPRAAPPDPTWRTRGHATSRAPAQVSDSSPSTQSPPSLALPSTPPRLCEDQR